MNNQPVIIYVTSRALTKGIVAIEAVPAHNMPGYMYGPSLSRGGVRNDYYSRGSYRNTMAEAIDRAREMQAKRIKRMEKQLSDMRALTFGEAA